MLTKLSIRNFKRLKDTGDIPLDNSVVFIGPNNSGKTTALQALSLWNIGLSKWIEKRVGKSKAKERTGVLINRKDIFAIPTPSARYLWNDLLVRESDRDKEGKVTGIKNINIEIVVEGINNGKIWTIGLEFGYSSEDVLYCRPIEISNNAVIINPEILKAIRIAYLPPMSGLILGEDKILPQTIAARIGEGRTAEVLRNLCYQVLNPEIAIVGNQINSVESWKFIADTIRKIFGVNLNEPFLNERGGIEITYKDERGSRLDLSSSGRGLQQVLLLIAYMMNNPRAVLLLDEPDAHLEILRQQQIYNLLTDLAREQGSQIIAASHSEIVLRESAEKDIVIAFIGKKPHRVNDKGAQLMKSLTTIGFEDYYQAELKKWVLYLEGSTDFSILKSFAKILKHKVSDYLETPFVHYVSTNRPRLARDHFHGLQAAVSDLKGIAIFDRIENPLQSTALEETMWTRYEIE
ncbi:MAG: AAA family ATPase, partial [Bacteroidota bacterium]